jgi:uncharacterized protein YlzI (FlbEa/FlbD family)
VICIHKLKGEPLWINPDQIAFVEGGRDCIVTMLDGRHLVTSDSPEDIARAMRLHRAQILALAGRLSTEELAALLPPVPSETGEPDASAIGGRYLRSVPSKES